MMCWQHQQWEEHTYEKHFHVTNISEVPDIIILTFCLDKLPTVIGENRACMHSHSTRASLSDEALR